MVIEHGARTNNCILYYRVYTVQAGVRMEPSETSFISGTAHAAVLLTLSKKEKQKPGLTILNVVQ